MKNKNILQIEEIHFKTTEKLIVKIDDIINEKQTKSKRFNLYLNGNILDVASLVNRYKLKPYTFEKTTYSLFKILVYPTLNKFATSPPSMYNNIIYKLNIKSINVTISQSPKCNYSNRFVSKTINNLDYNSKYIMLDIETTGLDPLIDDIIQICIYEKSFKHYVRYLPLNKRATNTAKDINYINDEILKDKQPLTQNEVNQIIKEFDLINKTIVIWTGRNLFDRTFLEIYFKEHNLYGLENLIFFNAKQLLNEIKDRICVKDFTKDHIANIYGYNIENSHEALADCKIEYEIVNQLLNKNFEPLYIDKSKEYIKKIKEIYIKNANKNMPLLKKDNCSQNKKMRLTLYFYKEK